MADDITDDSPPDATSSGDAAHILPTCGILAGLSDRARSNLATFGTYQTFAPGIEIIREGTKQNRLYIVIRGELTITCRTGGKEIQLSTAKDGECLGETSLLEPGLASATVRVVEESTVWSIDSEDLRAFVAEHTGGSGSLLMGIASCLSQRLRHANELIASHQVPPVETLPEGRERAITASNTLVQIGFFDRLKKSIAGEKKITIPSRIKL
jgi:CRP-like cAMP-binding protein